MIVSYSQAINITVYFYTLAAPDESSKYSICAGPVLWLHECTRTALALHCAFHPSTVFTHHIILFAYCIRVTSDYRIVTSAFFHAGLLHVGFNMMTLWSLGGAIERALGTVCFIGAPRRHCSLALQSVSIGTL